MMDKTKLDKVKKSLEKLEKAIETYDDKDSAFHKSFDDLLEFVNKNPETAKTWKPVVDTISGKFADINNIKMVSDIKSKAVKYRKAVEAYEEVSKVGEEKYRQDNEGDKKKIESLNMAIDMLELFNEHKSKIKEFRTNLNGLADALNVVTQNTKNCNKTINEKKPWTAEDVKEIADKLKQVLDEAADFATKIWDAGKAIYNVLSKFNFI